MSRKICSVLLGSDHPKLIFFPVTDTRDHVHTFFQPIHADEEELLDEELDAGTGFMPKNDAKLLPLLLR